MPCAQGPRHTDTITEEEKTSPFLVYFYNMTKFAIFGDSYVTHLERFTGGISEVSNCRFFGVSGMSTRRKFQDK